MRFYFLFSCFIFWGLGLYAQSFTFNQQIRGVDLPSETIRGLLQDTKGRMWFNTSMGVHYSDGFTTFPIPTPVQSVLSNDVGMFLDRDGWIWLFNHNKSAKVFFYDQLNWRELELPSDIVAQSSELYKRLVVFGQGKEKKLVFLDEEKLYIQERREAKWLSYDLPLREVGMYFTFFEESEEMLLFFENSIVSIKDGAPVFYEIQNPFENGRIYHVAKDNETYFFLGRNFLAKGKALNKVDEILTDGFEEPKYTHIDFSYLQVHNRKVYFFFNSQLMQYNPVSGQRLKIEAIQNLRSYSLSSAMVDREGIIWIASTRGLVNVSSLMFLNYNRREFIDDEITAIHVLDDDQYLLGFNNGLQLWEGNQVHTIQHFPDLFSQPKTRITNITSDRLGQVWISGNQQGVGKFTIKNKTVQFFNTPSKEEIIGVFPIGDSLYISAKNKVFLTGIQDPINELFKYDLTENWRDISRLKEFYVRKIGKLSDDRLMVLLGGNLYTDDSIRITPHHLFIVGFDYLELDNEILIGTEKGLKVFSNGELNDYERMGQTISRPVYALRRDDKGRVWAGTDKGLFLIDDEIIKNFTEKSGVAGSEINRGALQKSPNGQLLIGTHKGLTLYNPAEEIINLPPPYIEITSLAVLNSDEDNQEILQVSSTTNFIEVKYLAPSFLQSLDYIVYYYLEGFHDDWIQIINPRTNSITFSNLPPGNYRFHMKVSLGNQIETPVVSSNQFEILKPVYLRLWFILTVLLIFFLIGYLVSTLMTQLKEKGILKQAIDEKIYEASVTEDQFKNVWLSSKDGLSLSTEDGKIIAVNPALSKMVGIPEKVLEEIHLWDVFSDPNFYEEKRKEIESLIIKQGSTTFNMEIAMPFNTGLKVIDYFSTELKSEFNGKKVFLSVFTDITEQHEQEQRLQAAKEKAEEANRLKTSFLSNMSHEIRTPLNGILGTAEHIMLQRPDEKELVDQLEIILESGERLLHTINSILDLSKIEANKMEVKYQKTNINDFVAKVLMPLKAIAVKKGVLLTANYEQQPFVGMIDQRYVEMILNNLVGNAIKYSNNGLITVKVSKQDMFLVLRVEDQGIGMSEEYMKRMFQPFEQESDGYLRQYEGTGLGLTITKSLITLMGGSIEFESKKGEGTRVQVSIPLDKD
ncbi:MAG: ATP-binding protein [Mongoliitalea sp.]